LNIYRHKTLPLSQEKKSANGKTWQKIEYKHDEGLRKERILNIEILCLSPIFEYLFARPTLEEQTEEFVIPGQIDIILDASNIAKDDVPYNEQARFDNILKAKKYYLKKNLNVRIIADSKLRHQIDKFEEFEEACSREEIRESPRGKEADEYILKLAFAHPESKIVSNDSFSEWPDKFALRGNFEITKELFAKKERFIKFKLDREFIEFYNEQPKTVTPTETITATTIRPQDLECQPENPSEQKHKFKANTVYVVKDKNGITLNSYAICHVHNQQIPATLTNPN
jgi:hypothetical protein